MATPMKTALKILFVVSMAALIAACGPRGAKNNVQTNPQNQSMSSQNQGFHHRGGKLRRICAADIQKFCNGQNKIRKCLRNISDQLQPDCKTALEKAIERRRERREERRQMNNGQTNNGQTNGTQAPTQPQNQAAPQNGQQHSNSANDDDDDD
jgi:hypothetical protein